MWKGIFKATLFSSFVLTGCDFSHEIQIRNNSNFDILIQVDEPLEKGWLENGPTYRQWIFFKSGIVDSIHSYSIPPKTLIRVYGEMGYIPSNKPPFEYFKVIMNKDTFDLHSLKEIVPLLNQSPDSSGVFYFDIRDTTQFR